MECESEGGTIQFEEKKYNKKNSENTQIQQT